MRRIETAYEVRGMVSRVSSFDSATVGSGAIVNEVVLTYNSFGQLTNDQQSHAGAVSGSTAQVQYAYANGSANTIRPNTLTYPNGRVLNMNYGTASSMADALSRVAALVDSNGTTQLATYSYLGIAAPVEVPYPVPNLRYTLIGTAGGNDPDTGDIYYGLDRFGRIKDLTWRNFTTATNVVRLQHGYDRAGNRLFRKDLAANAAGQRFDELYTYDTAYRLAFMRRGTLNATNTAIAGGTLRAQQCFTLDSTGNWLGFRSDTNGDGTWDLVQSRTANTVNEITDITNTTGAAWVDPVYNTVGNMTTLPQPAAPTTSYTATYDAWNRLVKLADGANTVADYAYDGRKFRIVSRSYTAGVLSETRHHYYTAGWQCVEERLGTAPDTASADLQYVWGPRYVDDLVLRDKSSERLFAMQDANWNVVAIADASAVVQERYAYSPYGVPVFLTPTFTSRATSSFTWQRLFTGQTFDTPTGLHYFRNRMLHSQVGTFITRDPAKYASGLNIYRATFIPSRIDPTGLAEPNEMNEYWPYRNKDDWERNNRGPRREIPDDGPGLRRCIYECQDECYDMNPHWYDFKAYMDCIGGCREACRRLLPPPTGLQICCAPLDALPRMIGKCLPHHCWIRTANSERGLYAIEEDQPPGGGLPKSPCYGTRVEITDHAGNADRNYANCQDIDTSRVDMACIEKSIRIGTPRGEWGFGNQCQSTVNDIIRQCTY